MLNIFFSSKLLKILNIALQNQLNSLKVINLPDDSELVKDQNKIKSLTLNTSKVKKGFITFLSQNSLTSKSDLINYELLLKTYINAFVNRKHILEEIRKNNIKGFGSSLEGIDSLIFNSFYSMFKNFNFFLKFSSKTKNIFLKNQLLKFLKNFQLINKLMDNREYSVVYVQLNLLEMPLNSEIMKNYNLFNYSNKI